MPQSIVDAAKSGNKLDTLTALRDSIAATIETCESGRDMAALSKRLMEVMDEIEEINSMNVVTETPMSRRRAKADA